MGWSIGYDSTQGRDIGYGVPAECDHPECKVQIDRGLSYVCGGSPSGGEYGCGLFFCGGHLLMTEHGQLCEQCAKQLPAFEPKADSAEWTNHKLTHESWAEWRAANPEAVKLLLAKINDQAPGD